MLTMKVHCDVPQDRTITVKLPDQIEPGPHELVLVLDTPSANKKHVDAADTLMKLAGSVPAFGSTNGVEFQRSLRDEWS